MEKERLQEYTARVTQANRSELVVIIYEATLASIEEGKNYLKQGEIEAARHEIERARSMITELMGSLDLQYEISHYLRQLYVFAYRELCQGIANRDPEQLNHATDIFEALLPSFKEVAKQDDSEAVMKNVQTIYAGLTYGRGPLNETIDSGADANRGFEA